VTMEIQNPPNNAKEVISPTAADRAVVVEACHGTVAANDSDIRELARPSFDTENVKHQKSSRWRPERVILLLTRQSRTTKTTRWS
jgi:hypothetical protein